MGPQTQNFNSSAQLYSSWTRTWTNFMNDPAPFATRQDTLFSNALFFKMLGECGMFMENWLLISTDFLGLLQNSINLFKSFKTPQSRNFRCSHWHQPRLIRVRVVLHLQWFHQFYQESLPLQQSIVFTLLILQKYRGEQVFFHPLAPILRPMTLSLTQMSHWILLSPDAFNGTFASPRDYKCHTSFSHQHRLNPLFHNHFLSSTNCPICNFWL